MRGSDKPLSKTALKNQRKHEAKKVAKQVQLVFNPLRDHVGLCLSSCLLGSCTEFSPVHEQKLQIYKVMESLFQSAKKPHCFS